MGHAKQENTGQRTRHGAALLIAWAGAGAFALSLLYFLYSYLVRFGAEASAAAPATRAVLANVLLFTAFALHHSLLARARIKDRIRQLLPPALERSAYTWVASILFTLVCAFWQSVPGELYRLHGPAAAAGYTVQFLGVLLTARSSARLDVLALAGVRPVLEERRGHVPGHVQLETRGLYGFVRHPVYFAWILLVFGAPHMTMTRLVFGVVSTAYLAIAIPLEERSLVHTFGAEYRTYQQRVRWRMIPGIY